jgi:hypothetical protein
MRRDKLSSGGLVDGGGAEGIKVNAWTFDNVDS